MNRYATLLSGVIIVLMPFFLILTPLYVFMTSNFIQFEYSQPGFPPAQRFDLQERTYNAIQTVRYVRGETSLTDLQNLGVYNDREIKHLVDVRNVASGALLFHAVSGILILLALLVLVRSSLTRLAAARALLYGGILTLVVIVAIGLFSLVAFDQFFVTFHHMFFEGDSWLFNYTDSLIQFYPEVFWEAASYGIAGMVTLSAVVVALIGWFWQRSLFQHAAAAPQPASS